MLTYALLAFAVAAVGGLLLAASVLRGRLAPWALSLVHALLGATGLVMLVLAVTRGVAPMLATIALFILVVAALGGFYLASLHAKGTVAPKSIVVVHASAAVAGFLTLVGAVLQA